MTMKLRFFVSFAIWCSAAFLPIGMAAKTLYAINLSRSDLSAAAINESIETDRRNFEEACKEIYSTAGFDKMEVYHTIPGDSVQRVFENIINTLASVTSQEEDAIFIYYSGNGLQVGSNSLPRIAFGNQKVAATMTLPLEGIFCAVSNAPAHLKIIVADCCNNQKAPDNFHIIEQSVDYKGNSPFIDADTTALSVIKDDQALSPMRMLFSAKGAIAFYVQNGYNSFGNNDGGYMSRCLWQALDELEQGLISPSWHSLGTRLAVLTSEKTDGRCVITSKSRN